MRWGFFKIKNSRFLQNIFAGLVHVHYKLRASLESHEFYRDDSSVTSFRVLRVYKKSIERREESAFSPISQGATTESAIIIISTRAIHCFPKRYLIASSYSEPRRHYSIDSTHSSS